MAAFLHNIFAFPTVIFTVLLSILLIYWLFAIIGLLDHDILHLGTDIHSDAGMEGLAGLMLTLGLSGVPSTIVLVILAVIAWLVSYFIVYFFFFWESKWFTAIAGVAVVAMSSAISVFLTAKIVKPLRVLFRKAYVLPPEKALVGRVCKVRSSRVDDHQGEAVVTFEGADLIIKIRAVGEGQFSRGDVLTISEYVPEEGAYMVFRNLN